MRDVLALRGAGPVTRDGSRRASSGALGEVLAPAQLLWIETAARCGEAGVAAVREVAQSRLTDLQARAHALAHLPPATRAELSLAILTDAEEPVELAARALELLDHDRQHAVLDTARALLASCAAEQRGAGTAELRQLYLVALRVLGSRLELTAPELLALEHHVAVTGDLGSSLRSRLHALALELARASRQGLRGKALEERILALIDFAREQRVNPQLEQLSLDVLTSQVRRVLTDLGRRRRGDEAAIERSAEALVTVLVGHGSFGIRGGGTRIDPPVPLEEEILLALGRSADPAAIELLQRLAAQPESRHRAVACLALGLARERSSGTVLVHALLSPDPFTRLAAAESLRHLRGLAAEVDWFAGPSVTRNAAAERLFGALGR